MVGVPQNLVVEVNFKPRPRLFNTTPALDAPPLLV